MQCTRKEGGKFQIIVQLRDAADKRPCCLIGRPPSALHRHTPESGPSVLDLVAECHMVFR